MTTELFQVLAYQSGLKYEDLQLMTIGMILDYVQEFVDHNNPKKKRTRRATQQDFDAF
jgi:hypothetical protein